mmetsp:Transcript_16014/g.53992  ORF Transcript_16014/g.53992 Transcript_16014/m.53992 type:complete len:326 (-) Transcript_16014:797-1774(-)
MRRHGPGDVRRRRADARRRGGGGARRTRFGMRRSGDGGPRQIRGRRRQRQARLRVRHRRVGLARRRRRCGGEVGAVAVGNRLVRRRGALPRGGGLFARPRRRFSAWPRAERRADAAAKAGARSVCRARVAPPRTRFDKVARPGSRRFRPQETRSARPPLHVGAAQHFRCDAALGRLRGRRLGRVDADRRCPFGPRRVPPLHVPKAPRAAALRTLRRRRFAGRRRLAGRGRLAHRQPPLRRVRRRFVRRITTMRRGRAPRRGGARRCMRRRLRRVLHAARCLGKDRRRVRAGPRRRAHAPRFRFRRRGLGHGACVVVRAGFEGAEL